MCRCIDHDFQSIHQAVEVIERYEAILGEAGQKCKKSSLRSLDLEIGDRNNDPSVVGILRKLDARLDKLESLSLVQQIADREEGPKPERRPAHANKSNRCSFFCNSPNHLVKNCPEITLQGSKPRYQGQANSVLQGNSVLQNSAWQVSQYSAQQMHPQHFRSLSNFPIQYPVPKCPGNGKLSTQ